MITGLAGLKLAGLFFTNYMIGDGFNYAEFVKTRVS
jgi:hypothetical protein